MVRSLFGFSIFAIVAIIASKLLFGLLGVAIGLVGKLLWLAFLGWLFYLVLKLFAPETASKVSRLDCPIWMRLMSTSLTCRST